MTLATVAIAFVYFAGAGQTQNEHNQVYGESFDRQVGGSRLDGSGES